MIIRKAKKEDFEEYFKLETEFAKDTNKIEEVKALHYSLIKTGIKKNFFKKLKKKNTLLLVLDNGKKLQGYISGDIFKKSSNGYILRENFGYLENIFITKKSRGKGYSSQLKQELFKWFKSKGINYSLVHVYINNSALKIYKKWGFKHSQYKMICKLK